MRVYYYRSEQLLYYTDVTACDDEVTPADIELDAANGADVDGDSRTGVTLQSSGESKLIVGTNIEERGVAVDGDTAPTDTAVDEEEVDNVDATEDEDNDEEYLLDVNTACLDEANDATG